MEEKRLIGLDIAKIAACFMVILMHTMRLSDPSVKSGAPIYYLTRCAIPIFFMAAGYVRLNRERAFTQWLVKALKIIGTIFFWIALYICVSFVLGKGINLRELLGLFVNRGPLGIMWFFASLAIFTAAAYPLNLLLKKKYGYITLILVFAVVCHAADAYNIVNITVNGADTFVQEAVPQTLRLWTWGLYFVAGGAIAKYKPNSPPTGILLAMTGVLSFLAEKYMYFMCKTATNVVNAEYMYDSPVVALWCAAVFLCFLRLPDAAARFTRPLNAALVPVCVMHYPILKILVKLIAEPTLGEQLLIWIFVSVLCFIAGIVMSKIPIMKNFTKF